MRSSRMASSRSSSTADAVSPELSTALARQATHLIVSIAPDEARRSGAGAARRDDLPQRMPKLRWIGYLSTVGVYGDHGGGWVDETSECRPVSSRSVAARRGRKGVAGARARNRRASRRPQAVRHLRAGPQRLRQSRQRHGEAADQARPGVQPHPCRRHRRRAVASRGTRTRRHLQRHRRPARAAAGRGRLCRRS